MKLIFPSNLIIQTWLDIASYNKYPEAQDIAYQKLHQYFDDILQAELYIEMSKIKRSAKTY